MSLKILSLALMLFSTHMTAQELTLSYGKTEIKSKLSYSYELEYEQKISEYTSASVIYLNEGHFLNSHKDMTALEINKLFSVAPRFIFSIGGGATYLYDTQDVKNVHSLGLMYSSSIKYYMSDHIYSKLTFNQNNTKNSTLLFGIGYSFDRQHISKETKMVKNGEFVLYTGKSVLNTPSCPVSSAYSFEYRQHVNKYIDLTTALINETQRKSISLEGWAVKQLSNHLTVGVGVGPYLTFNPSAIVSFTVSSQVSKNYNIRAIFHRVITSNSKDADIFLIGIGYKF
jgi:hypothetical protein